MRSPGDFASVFIQDATPSTLYGMVHS